MTLLKTQRGPGLTAHNYLGSDCTGSDKTTGRVLSVDIAPVIIMLETKVLRPTEDYTVSGTDITFNMALDDRMGITIWY